MTKIYDYLMRKQMSKYNTNCNFCRKYIYLEERDPYYFKIVGIGKYDKAIICSNCLQKKILNLPIRKTDYSSDSD